MAGGKQEFAPIDEKRKAKIILKRVMITREIERLYKECYPEKEMKQGDLI
jgi:hypothetical protein